MFRKILAGLLALAGLAAAVAGILSATVYRPSDTVTATMDAPTTPLVIIEPGVLGLVADEVTMVATAADPEATITVITSPTYDVEAWVGSAAVTRITGLADWETLATAEVEGEATVPNPAGADLWRMENTATGEFSAIITPPSGAVSVLLATDGTEPAPVVSLTWPVAVTTPYLVPLLVAGGVLLLAALALAFAGRRAAESTGGASRTLRASRTEAAPAPVVDGDAAPAGLTRRQLRELERQRRAENPRLGAEGPIQTTAGAVGAGVVPGVIDPERFRALRHVESVEETDVIPALRDLKDAGPAAGAAIIPGAPHSDQFRFEGTEKSGAAAGAAVVPGVVNPDRFRSTEEDESGPAPDAASDGPDATAFREEASAPERTSWRDLWGMTDKEEPR